MEYQKVQEDLAHVSRKYTTEVSENGDGSVTLVLRAGAVSASAVVTDEAKLEETVRDLEKQVDEQRKS